MSQSNPKKTLTCFYDLKVAPFSFDFVTYMIISDLHRVLLECDSIHLVVVPNRSTGLNFSGHEIAFSDDHATWRIFNMKLQIAGLIEKCHGITICPNRDYAQVILDAGEGPVYPKHYNLENPPENSWIFPIALMYANLGMEIPSLAAPRQALEYANTWINEHSQGKKVISITLREGTHNSVRNSIIEAWSEFVQWIDRDDYFPVIIPDIENFAEAGRPEFSDTTFFPEAVFNLQLRTAFYQTCYLNLIIGAGPEELMRYNGRVRYIKFKSIAPFELDWEPSHALRHGLPPNGQYPFVTPYQKIVLQEETCELIKSEFAIMVDKIEASPIEAFTPQKLQLQQPATSEHKIEVFLRYIAGNQIFYAMKFAILCIELAPQDEEVKGFLIDYLFESIFAGPAEWLASSIMELINDAHKDAPIEPLWLVAIALHEIGIGHWNDAIEWLSKAQAIVKFGTPVHAITNSCFGLIEFNNENFERSVAYNRAAFESYPSGNSRSRLVSALEHAGEIDEAIEHLKMSLQDETDQANIHRRLALLLKQTGRLKESIDHMMKGENFG